MGGRFLPAVLWGLATFSTITHGATVVPSDPSAFVAAHNVLRCMHGAPPLVWSSALSASAQTWATACNGQPTNASTLQQLNVGENIVGTTLAFPSPQAMLDIWYAQESPLVDWASPTLQPATQHLTQILWKASTQLGCAQCVEGGDSDKRWTVCQYSVAGNDLGSVAANVLPPLHSRQDCTGAPSSPSPTIPERPRPASASPSPGAGYPTRPLAPPATADTPSALVWDVKPAQSSAFVAAHNVLRCMHGAPPLSWSSALAETALAWASVCNGQPTNASTLQQLNVGENIVGTTLAFPSPQSLLDIWYTQESPLVDWASPTLQLSTQHLTQILWKASTQLACAQCAEGGDSDKRWTVCQYSVAGNDPNSVAANVLPPLHSRQDCTVPDSSPSASSSPSGLPPRQRVPSDSPSPAPATPRDSPSPSASQVAVASATVLALQPTQSSAFVSAHNVLRCMHGAPPLSWSSALAESALAWATVCNGQPTNASTLQQLNVGENVVGSTLAFPSPQTMLDFWYAQEAPLVDWASPLLQPATQPLTQILWKASTQLGCAQCAEGGDSDKRWTVCQYSVAGNDPSSVAANVLPPLHSHQDCTVSASSPSPSPSASAPGLPPHMASDSPSPVPAVPSDSPSPPASQSPPPTPSASGSKCADEGGVCSCTGLVQFGVRIFWSVPRAVNGQVACTTNQFGDPAVGKVKACYCLPVPTSADPTAALHALFIPSPSPSAIPSLSAVASGYTKCADEQGICSCSGLVQYGVGNAWTTPRAINGQIVCSNNQFGDPKQGKVKACYCLAASLTANAAAIADDAVSVSEPSPSSSSVWPWLALPFALLAVAAVVGALLYCHCRRRARQQRAETFLDPEGLRWDAAAPTHTAADSGCPSPAPAPALLPEDGVFSPTGRASPTVPPPTPGSPVVSQPLV